MVKYESTNFNGENIELKPQELRQLLYYYASENTEP